MAPPPSVTRRRALLAELDPRTISGPRVPLLVFCLTSLLAGWDDKALQLALPEIQDDLGLSLTAVGTIASVTMVVTTVAGLPLGYLVDRMRNRVRLIQYGEVAANLGDFIQALAPNGATLLAGRALGSVARVPDGVAQLPLLADYYSPASRGRVIALLKAAATVGGLIGAPVAGLLVTAYGWRHATLMLAVLATAVACTTFLLKEPVKGGTDRAAAGLRAPAEPPPPPRFWEGVRAAWAIRTLRLQAISGFVYSLIGGPLTMTVALMAARDYALTPFQRSMMMEAQLVAGLVAVLVAGLLNDRLVARRPSGLALVQGVGTLAIAVLVLAVGLVPGLTVFVAANVVFSVIVAMQTPTYLAMMAHVLPARHRGVGFQLAVPFQLLGSVLGPLLLALTEGMGLRYVLLSTVPFVVAAALVQLAATRSVAGDIDAARRAA
ncbi:MFS transporter [Nonomuraea sp. NPDC005650]|uniref:MFS transporter n=1 Tax=Nonomuraea sp. NPDC005650 TaxID=3157045 RepID=UPI0033BAB415